MLDGKLIATLLALIGVLTIMNNNKVKSHENFLGNLPSLGWKRVRVAKKGADFYSVPMFQSNLSPRMQNVQYPAQIRYNLPSVDHLASDPLDPLSNKKHHMVENYSNGCSSVKTDSFHSKPLMNSDYAAGDYIQTLNDAADDSKHKSLQSLSMVPSGEMTTLNADGEQEQVVMFDRYMTTNKVDRNYGQADMIRGDLSIAPCETGEWFRPSANPATTLNPGALAVLGGTEQAESIASLINYSSGNTTLGGVDMSTRQNTMTGQSMSDVMVTAFP